MIALVEQAHPATEGPQKASTTRSPVSPPKSSPKNRIAFIDIGRGLGALLVFYSHIAHPWVIAKGESAPYISFIEALTSDPMHMTKQGIGQIAVPFFFLVSGYVVTPIALKQGQGRFAVNRFIRVYAPMVFVVLLTALLMLVNLHPPSTGQSQDLNPLTVLTNTALVNYLIFPQVVLVPVAWTMIVEVLFYLLLMAVVPLLRRWVWLGIALELTFIFVVMMSRSQLNASYSLFAVNVSYLPAMLLGQIIWATTTKKIPLWTGGVLTGVAWSLYVLADVLDVGRIDTSYNLSLAFAVLCFMMGYFAEPKLRQWNFWTAMSERSYSLYLLHMLVSFVVLQLLRPILPFPIAVIIAIGAVFGVVELSYRFVERPSHLLARKLSHRAPAREAAPEPPTDEPAPAAGPRHTRTAPNGASSSDGDTQRRQPPRHRQRPAPAVSDATVEMPRIRRRATPDEVPTEVTPAVDERRSFAGRLDGPRHARRVTPKR